MSLFNCTCRLGIKTKHQLSVALLQNSDSVSLDLLTYADLESLRNRKAGAGAGRPTIPGAHRATAAVLSSKRYLILTYTVEFDRSVACCSLKTAFACL